MEMRDVVGYEDYYAVTDDGRVWSKRNQCFLTSYKCRENDYPRVNLCTEGTRKQVLVHRLVCRAFHGVAPGPDYQVDHINADKDDARASNLRWVTARENTQHALELGHIHTRPIVGFNEEGDVIRFASTQDAARAGFNGVSQVLSRENFLCKGYAFVYEEEWGQIESALGFYFEQLELVRVRRRKHARREVRRCRIRGTSVANGSIVEFFNLKEAVEAGYTSVGACLAGKLKTCGGRVWEALDEYEPRRNKGGAGRKPTQVKLIGTSLKDGSTVEFGSFKEAREAGFSGVRDCIVGRSKTCGGYTWVAPDGYTPRKYEKSGEVA